MCKQFRNGLYVIVILTLLITPRGVYAQEGQPTDDDVNRIAKRLYCPVCESTPLDVCGTQACIDWRDEIRLKLAEGWSEEEIFQYFVDQHGAQVLPEPPAEGFNLLVYILPPVILLVGALILVRSLRGWRQPVKVERSSLSKDEQDSYMKRIEEELQRRQGGA